ncbi:MAG: DUF6116 family protein [Luteimonas sp.]
MPNPLLGPAMRWLGRLSYPRLFLVAAALFVGDMLIPDVIPFVDEILLGLGTLLLANWKNRKAPLDAPIEGDSTRR